MEGLNPASSPTIKTGKKRYKSPDVLQRENLEEEYQKILKKEEKKKWLKQCSKKR